MLLVYCGFLRFFMHVFCIFILPRIVFPLFIDKMSKNAEEEEEEEEAGKREI